MTMYDEFKKAHEIPNKAAKRFDTTPDSVHCPLSDGKFCKVALEQGREFPCNGWWWRSCGIYYRHKNGQPIGGF